MTKEMNMGELCLHIGCLFDKYSVAGVCPAHLCIWEGELQIRFCGHTSIQHPSFFKFTHHTLEHGLTGAQWRKLTQSVYDYLRRNDPCQKTSKPLTTAKLPHS